MALMKDHPWLSEVVMKEASEGISKDWITPDRLKKIGKTMLEEKYMYPGKWACQGDDIVVIDEVRFHDSSWLFAIYILAGSLSCLLLMRLFFPLTFWVPVLGLDIVNGYDTHD